MVQTHQSEDFSLNSLFPYCVDNENKANTVFLEDKGRIFLFDCVMKCTIGMLSYLIKYWQLIFLNFFLMGLLLHLEVIVKQKR